jgi:hypothetical protein
VPVSDNDIAVVRKVGGMFAADQAYNKAPPSAGKVQAGNGGINATTGNPAAPGSGGRIIIYENIGD